MRSTLLQLLWLFVLAHVQLRRVGSHVQRRLLHLWQRGSRVLRGHQVAHLGVRLLPRLHSVHFHLLERRERKLCPVLMRNVWQRERL